MNIREMTIADYDAVFALWTATEGLGLNRQNDSREGIAKFLARNPESCFVAEEGGKIIGVIMAGSDGRRAYIYHTAVSAEHRGKGIGSALLKKCTDTLTAQGVHKVALLVFAQNEAGNAFWEKHGFIKRTDVNYRNKTLIEHTRLDS